MGSIRFFQRGQLKFRSSEVNINYIPAEPENIDQVLFLPVQERYWQQRDIDEYTGDDLLDIIEMIQVDRENQIRAEKASERG